MEKELEDQRASLLKHKTALEQQAKANLEKLREELRKEFRDEMEKEKIVNRELRQADAANRQSDIAEITKNFIVSEIKKYLANSGN